MAGLPPEIKALVELSPVEDVLLALLRPELPGIQVKTLIAQHQTFPLVLIRRLPTFGEWDGDARFTDTARVAIYTFCEDPDGDEDAALLGEACRVVLRDSLHKVIPGRGHLTRVQLNSAPRRVTDWATSTGPVQYADLPTGVHRYESIYDFDVRRDLSARPYPLNP